MSTLLLNLLGSGKKAGEYYTPQTASTILSEIVTLDSQDPALGKKKTLNMLLHGVKDSEFEIYHGDSLLNDWDILREINPSKKWNLMPS